MFLSTCEALIHFIWISDVKIMNNLGFGAIWTSFWKNNLWDSFLNVIFTIFLTRLVLRARIISLLWLLHFNYFLELLINDLVFLSIFDLLLFNNFLKNENHAFKKKKILDSQLNSSTSIVQSFLQTAVKVI